MCLCGELLEQQVNGVVCFTLKAMKNQVGELLLPKLQMHHEKRRSDPHLCPVITGK